MVAPVAVGADPDLEQRRLVSCTGRSPVAVNVRIPGPDQTSEKPRALDLALPARAAAVDEPFHSAADLALLHARPAAARACSMASAGDLVGEAHPLELLLRLEHARLGEERRRVDGGGNASNQLRRERRRLADHAVGGLRAERELEADALEAGAASRASLERTRACGGRGSRSS